MTASNNNHELSQSFHRSADGLPLTSTPDGLVTQLSAERRRVQRGRAARTTAGVAAGLVLAVGGYLLAAGAWQERGTEQVNMTQPSQPTTPPATTKTEPSERQYFSPVTYTPVTMEEAKKIQRVGDRIASECMKERGVPIPYPFASALPVHNAVFPLWNVYTIMSRDLRSPLPADADKPIGDVGIRQDRTIDNFSTVQNEEFFGKQEQVGPEEPHTDEEIREALNRKIVDDPKSCSALVERRLLGSEEKRLEHIEARIAHANVGIDEHQARVMKIEQEFYTCLYNERHPKAPKEVATAKDVESWLHRGLSLGYPYDASSDDGVNGTSTMCRSSEPPSVIGDANSQSVSQELALLHDADVGKTRPDLTRQLQETKRMILANAENLSSE